MDPDILEGYGEQIVGADPDDLQDILSGLGYDGDDDDVGRRGRRNPRHMMAIIKKLQHQLKVARHGGHRVVPVHNTQARRYPLGLGVTNVLAGAAAIISVQPQLPFKIERFITAVTGFSINNIQVGTVSQFVAAGAVPSEVFTPNAIGVALRGDTAVPGVQIQITVTNTTIAAADFSGALVGLVAQ